MFADWLDAHRDIICDKYVAKRQKRGDMRPVEAIQDAVLMILNALVKSMRENIDWTMSIRTATRQALDVGGSPLDAVVEASYGFYTIVWDLLDEQQPEEHADWVGVMGDYMLASSLVTTKVLEERLVTESQAQYRTILNALDDVVQVVDRDLNLVLYNTTFEQLVKIVGTTGVVGMNLFEVLPFLRATDRGRYDEVFRTGEMLFYEDAAEIGGMIRILENRMIPICKDDCVEQVMTIMRDVTERKQFEQERAQLQQEIIEAQQQALKELSAPIIPVIEGIIVMPLVGSLDTGRAQEITRALLTGITHYRASVVVLDITGVTVVDSGVADHLNKTIQAAQLKGARAILTGISDAVAEAVVDLGIDWEELDTVRDLQTGLVVALAEMGRRIVTK